MNQHESLDQMNKNGYKLWEGKIPFPPKCFDERSQHPRQNLYLFVGTKDAIPNQLFFDRRLTPSDRYGWIALRALLGNKKVGRVGVEDLQRFFSCDLLHGNASRETITRIMAHLRLCGWLRLAETSQERDFYMLYDEPRSIRQRLLMDATYPGFVEQMMFHPCKSTRVLATIVKDEMDEVEATSACNHRVSHSIKAVSERQWQWVKNP